MRQRVALYFKFAFFVLAGALLVFAIHMTLFVMNPASKAKEFKEVLISEGATFRSVATELRKDGIISDVNSFIVLGRIKGVTRKIRAGFYSFNTQMRPLEVLDVLKQGKIIEYQVVIPEGYDMDKVAGAVAATGIVTKEEFLKKASDPAFVHSLGIAGNTLEGYLFPATYFFPKGLTLEGMIKQMVTKFRGVFGDELKTRAAEIGMTEYQVVTLASIIEREAFLDSERMLISAVNHNRMKLGIPLQSDPTVIYSLERKGRWKGDLTKEDLRSDDPYNTYRHQGLPPGPIANPGKPSIIAALYPADVDYIYFVSKNDGTHYFSSSLAEHNRAVQKYQVMAKMENITSTQKKEGAWRKKK